MNFTNCIFDLYTCEFKSVNYLNCKYNNLLSYNSAIVQKVLYYLKSITNDNTLDALDFLVKLINPSFKNVFIINGKKSVNKDNFIFLIKYVFDNLIIHCNSSEFINLSSFDDKIYYIYSCKVPFKSKNCKCLISVDFTTIDNDYFNSTELFINNSNIDLSYLFNDDFKEALLWLIVNEYQRSFSLNIL